MTAMLILGLGTTACEMDPDEDIGSIHALESPLQVKVTNATTGQIVQPYTSASSISLAGGDYIFTLRSRVGVSTMRMEARNAACDIGRIPDIHGESRFTEGQMRASASNVRCSMLFTTWYENFDWVAHHPMEITFGDESVQHPSEAYVITVGTAQRSAMDTSSPTVEESAHGTRLYCPISHFSYDDPIVFPNEPGSSHLHMYWGNTGANAASSTQSLASSGNSTCEGGLNNKSSYWMPALFNAANEAMVPERVFAYYKSFGTTPSFDRNQIKPIPNGLQMLATLDINNSGPWNFNVGQGRSQNELLLGMNFPTCLQVDSAGKPVLLSADNRSHLSYASGSGQTSSDCPASHPYRIPQLSYKVYYNVDPNSRWYLSSDASPESQGQSLHGDYFASWDKETMDRVVLCNRQKKKECDFVGGRTQLPERFFAPDGTPVYESSGQLSDDQDRTPFGQSLKTSKH